MILCHQGVMSHYKPFENIPFLLVTSQVGIICNITPFSFSDTYCIRPRCVAHFECNSAHYSAHTQRRVFEKSRWPQQTVSDKLVSELKLKQILVEGSRTTSLRVWWFEKLVNTKEL